jgi:hypothetical protein
MSSEKAQGSSTAILPPATPTMIASLQFYFRTKCLEGQFHLRSSIAMELLRSTIEENSLLCQFPALTHAGKAANNLSMKGRSAPAVSAVSAPKPYPLDAAFLPSLTMVTIIRIMMKGSSIALDAGHVFSLSYCKR